MPLFIYIWISIESQLIYIQTRIENPETQVTLVIDSKSRDTGNFGHRFKIQSENGRSREKNQYVYGRSVSELGTGTSKTNWSKPIF